MGAITDAIEAVKERDDLDTRQKSAGYAKLKATAHEAAFVSARGQDGRLVLDRKDGRVITATFLERRDALIKLHIEWTNDGKPQPFDNPWYVVNPPCLVSDPAGDIVRERHDPETGEVVETRRFREDPMAALVEIIDDKCRKPVRVGRG